MKWKQTCGACPEQYDIFKKGERVGYFRLRHGWLSVECPGINGTVVYETSDFGGDGCFADQAAREKHLHKAEKKIKKWLKEQKFKEFGE